MAFELAPVLVLTGLAGAAVPLGGLLARYENMALGPVRDDVLRGILAFGGGVLMAAVALVLVPEGIHLSDPVGVPIIMLMSAVVFMYIDRAIQESGAAGSNALAMVMDFVPESIALGAAVAVGGTEGLVLAFLIGLQNLPEGFNAYREMREHGGMGRRTIFLILLAIVPLGPIAGITGYYLLAGQDLALGAVYLFASSGILYLTFQDIVPMAHRDGHYAPTLGAVIGFTVGMMGQIILGAG